MDKGPIGVFDSGVGGLSVLKELVKLMPRENYIFVADQFNVPYGEKTKAELEKITLNICKFLVSKKSKIVVAACNTATCHALSFLRSRVNVPVVGTVPAIKPAAERSLSGKIGVLSTPATAKSAYLKDLIKVHAPNMRVIRIGCLNLENAVETGDLNSPKVSRLLTKYIKPVKDAGADIIVLGCTHYPFLKNQIKQLAGGKIKTIDSGRAVARRTKKLLKDMDILNKSADSAGDIDFYTTGNQNKFSRVASVLLGRPVKARRIILSTNFPLPRP